MRVLFITRTYPPLVGGMERFASDFYENYRQVGEIDLLANSGGKKTLPFFLFKALFILMMNSRKYDVIHLYDAVLSPIVPAIRFFSRAKISFTVNGLDVVFSSFGYQRIMPFFLNMADRIIAISGYTMEQCKIRGIASEKTMTIPIGVSFENLQACSESMKARLLSKLDIPSGKKILLTVGRLVKRKGHAWFIRNVFVKLPPDYIYLLAGHGPEFDEIKKIIRELSLTSRVYLLGQISDEEKNCLYQIADLFIMPNIKVKDDQEGFGIVLLEAGQYGLPVIASDIDGIKDAVVKDQTGILIKEKDIQGFVDAITNLEIDSSTIINVVALNYDWRNVAKKYNEEFRNMIAG